MHFARESIFVSSVRSFCTGLFGFLGFFISLAIAGILLMIFSSSTQPPEKTTFVLEPDANGSRTLLPPDSPAILKISIHGIIGTDKLNSSTIENILIDSRQTLMRSDRIKGILLDINTPGGTVTDADNIYRMLLRYKEKFQIPIYAYVNGLCASGGVYVSSAADKIYASSVSVIGSVGVVLGPAFNFSELMQKWGIKAHTLTQGIDKDMLNPFRPWRDGEDACLQAVMKFQYQNFVDIVTSHRPNLNKKLLVDEYGAQIYAAPKAEALGYIDVSNASYEETLKDLVLKAGIEENTPYQVFELRIQRPLFADLLQGSLGFDVSSFLNGKYLTQKEQPMFYYIYQPALY